MGCQTRGGPPQKSPRFSVGERNRPQMKMVDPRTFLLDDSELDNFMTNISAEGLHDMHAYLQKMTDEEFRQLSARSHYSLQLSARTHNSVGNPLSARGSLSARGPLSARTPRSVVRKQDTPRAHGDIIEPSDVSGD